MCVSLKKVTGVLCIFLMCLYSVVYSQSCPPGQVCTTEIVSAKSTSVSTDSPTTSQGTSSYLKVGNTRLATFPSGYIIITERTFVDFNLSTIPSTAVVLSAQLKLRQTSGTGTPQIITGRTATSWTEGVTWATQPSIQTDDQVSTYTMNNSWMVVDVKEHVQKMIAGVYPNNGWILKGDPSVEASINSVAKTFYSDNYSTASERPRLEVSYYIPMSVSHASIVHTSSSAAQNGSISPVLANGPGGTYTYQWYNKNGVMSGKTALNLTGVPYGWYGLRVTSSVAGTTPFYYAFLVGVNCENVPIEFNPGPDYIDDAVLQGPSLSVQSFQNYGSDSYESALDQVFFGFPIENRTLIRFRLWIDSSLSVNNAILVLKASHNDSERSNASRLKRATGDWHEKIVTHSSTPQTSTDILVNVSELLSPTEEKSINVIDFWQYWKQNNEQNFGFLFELQSYTGTLATQRYFSSDVTAANRPKMNFNVGSSNPIAPHYCNQSFAKTERSLRGVRYKPYMGYLYFYYDEEYIPSGQGLNYKVYKDNNPLTTVLDSVIQPLTEIEYGDNRYVLKTTSLSVGFYVLEITNNKQEKFYLRFKVED